MRILSSDDLKLVLSMKQAIESQRKAFLAWSTGEADVPLRTSLSVPEKSATLLFMPARVGTKIGAKIISLFPSNAKKNLPVIHGLALLLDPDTGVPRALMDATYLTALRTGAGAGVATDLLALPSARVGAIVGAGKQAETQLLAMVEVRELEEVRIHGRDQNRILKFVEKMQGKVRAKLKYESDLKQALTDADIVTTATSSTTPVITGSLLKPGAHVNGIGSYTAAMKEVDSTTISRAKRVFVDSIESCLKEAGEVITAMEEGTLKRDALIEIGSVIAKTQAGRQAPEEITFFKSVGIAAQDIVAAEFAFEQATTLGIGTEVSL